LLEGGASGTGEGQTPPKRLRGPLQSSVTLASIRSPRSSPAPHRLRKDSDDDIYINLTNNFDSPSSSSLSDASDFNEECPPVLNGYVNESPSLALSNNLTNGASTVEDWSSNSDPMASEVKSLINGSGEDTTSAAAAARALLRRRQNSYGHVHNGNTGGSDSLNCSQAKVQHLYKFQENVAVYERIRGMIRSPFIDGHKIFKQLVLLTGKLEHRHAVLLALIAEARNMRVYKLERLLDKYRVAMLCKVAVAAQPDAGGRLRSTSCAGRDEGDADVTSTCSNSVTATAEEKLLQSVSDNRRIRGPVTEQCRAQALLDSGPRVVVTEKRLKLERHRQQRFRTSSNARGLT